MSNPVKIIGESISGVLNSMDHLITSKDERMERDNQMAEIRNDLAGIQRDVYSKAAEMEETLIKAKQGVLQAELSGTKLQRSWRPVVMLSFAFIVIYQFFLVHLLNSIFIMFNTSDPLVLPLIDMPDHFWTLLEIGIGGYVAGRSLEKIAPNITKSIMDAKESRRMTEELQTKQAEREQKRELRQERFITRQERKEKRREDRQERREERREDRTATRVLVSDELENTNSPAELSRRQKRKLRRQKRREEGRQKLGQLFKD